MRVPAALDQTLCFLRFDIRVSFDDGTGTAARPLTRFGAVNCLKGDTFPGAGELRKRFYSIYILQTGNSNSYAEPPRSPADYPSFAPAS